MQNQEIFDFIEQNDVKFVRLTFCDPLGVPKNISVLASELKSILKNGYPLNVSMFPVLSDLSQSDILLYPDTQSFNLLPWRPHNNSVLRFYCEMQKIDHAPFDGDGRTFLQNAIHSLESYGLKCEMGTKCEFYLFKTDDQEEPTTTPFDNGGLLDIAPLDKGENIRRDICLCLEEMGLKPKSSHHEQGPGQNQIEFKLDDPLSAADHFMTFKSVIKMIAHQYGLFASFMPNPLPSQIGSSLQLQLTLTKNGKSVFGNHNDPNFKTAQYFLAGILEKIPEITLFLNPINNSYERLGHFNAPKFISWSHQNVAALVRFPSSYKEKQRLELRSPDPTLNPYFAFGLIIYAGLWGIENQHSLEDSIDFNLNEMNPLESTQLKSLPHTLKEAIDLTRNSDFVQSHLDQSFLNHFLDFKEKENLSFEQANDKFAYYLENHFKSL